ncbi:MAG TPA: hypothetical protein VE338_01140 [Ktedonobacterales bacterium]|nr:hypothetical protein [Ktedonobacterales bacterium]
MTHQAAHAAHAAACWAEVMSTRLSQTFAETRQPAPPLPLGAPSARASADFTSQVMARLSTPAPDPDPRETRAKLMRAHARRLASVYATLLLASGVVLLALTVVAPWLLLGLVAAIVSAVLLAMTFATFVSRLTGGLVSGFGVAYLAMLATLTPPLLLLARRSGRGRFPTSRRL